ncbi:hypothetical protein KY334_05760 [Candidatus Woesearchaeota archaeon]|nr:hypothetical protein [Candidatus Woesearchaeota archaeon]
MPYSSIKAAINANFPVTVEDINLTLEQINKLADIYDGIKTSENVDNPMAVAWGTWKKLYKKEDGKWIKKIEKKEEMKKIEPLNIMDIDIPLHVFTVGTWNGVTVTEKDVDEMISNFQNKVAEGYVTVNHDDKLTALLAKTLKVMSLGNVKTMFRKGKDLFITLKRVPALIAQLINSGSMGKRSIEFYKNYKHGNGNIYKNVFRGITFHGADGFPAISTLSDIPKLFKVEDLELDILNNEEESLDTLKQLLPATCFKEEIEQDETQIVSLSLEELSNINKEDNIKMKVEILKTEYEELLSFKNQNENLIKEKETVQSDITKLKTENDNLKTENDNLKTDVENSKKELEQYEALKTKIAEDNKNAIKNEAKGFIRKMVEEKKLKPKYEDQKIKDYIRYKNENDEEGLNLFKEDLETRDEIINFDTYVTGNDTSTKKKINWETGEGLNEAIDLKIKDNPKLTFEQARMELENEFNQGGN